MTSQLLSILLGIINFLSLVIISGLAFFLRSMWVDMKEMRTELTVIQTEHRMQMTRCAEHAHEHHASP